MYVFRADVGRAFALSNVETKCVRAATPRYFVINAHISCGTYERDNLYAEGGGGEGEQMYVHLSRGSL